MNCSVRLATADEILPLRTRQRAEANCQIVHDSIHGREGWTLSYSLHCDGSAVVLGGVAIGGPWTGEPTFFEFYVLPEFRDRAFVLFEAFVAAGQPRFF